MGRLTTHVLDLTNGGPASGVRLALYQVDAGARRLVTERETNQDGRCDQPLLSGADMRDGIFELEFDAGGYFDRTGIAEPKGRFLTTISLRFTISDPAADYHVPLLLSPYGYSTYRGS
jgi:5-hydroxyisourate hydrolase